jgi:uncharacterized protein YjbI with pentapeptide repeats
LFKHKKARIVESQQSGLLLLNQQRQTPGNSFQKVIICALRDLHKPGPDLNSKMKGKRYLLIGLVLGMVIGWPLGFLRLPYLEENSSFLLGIFAGLALVSLMFLLLKLWNRGFQPGLMNKQTDPGDLKTTRRQSFIWIVALSMVALGGIWLGSTIYRQYESFKLQIEKKDRQIQEMAALVASVKKTDPEPLIRSLLHDVGEELKQNPDRSLRDTTIARIAALSFAFKPFKYIAGDSLSPKAYSPGRGQLLQALVWMKIDSASFARIKTKALFAAADLEGIDLKGVDFSRINLKEANLKSADLSSANLKGADLSDANLWGVKLNHANLSNSVFKRADLSWAQLNEATLSFANLNGANLTNAQLLKADLNAVSLLWSNSEGALFNEAILTNGKFFGANFSKANLSQANLSNTDLRSINFSHADLVGAEFDHAKVEKDWLDQLKAWQPAGLNELLEQYRVENDAYDTWNRPWYHMTKKQNY